MLVLSAGSRTAVNAATITVSSTITPGFTLTESALDARYKFDANNWDIALFVPATRAPNGSNTANLGSDISFFNGVPQNFKLALSGGSLTYTLGTKSISRNGLASISALDITPTLSPPFGRWLHRRNANTKSGFHGCYRGNTFSLNGLALAGQSAVNHEYIFSDTDLTKFAWSLSGQVTLGMLYTGAALNTNENLKMDIAGGTLMPSVPDVGTKYLVAMGLALILLGHPRLQKRFKGHHRNTMESEAPVPRRG